MTYSLFEYGKENIETLLANQPEAVEVVPDTKDICDSMKNTNLRGMNEHICNICVKRYSHLNSLIWPK